MSSDTPRRFPALFAFVVPLIPFVLLATANSAGYRYGASDLAFYGPAVMHALDPRLFPRDAPLIDAQAHLTYMDETVAAVARATTEDLPGLFLALYLVTLALLAFACASIGAVLYRHRWTGVALMAALTLRHAIPRSGTNTLEAYFHPRQLAFAFGALAVAAFLRGRVFGSAAALLAAACLHPTTTLWFGIWLGVAAFLSERRLRRPIVVAAIAVLALGTWWTVAGPLEGRLTLMDDEWLAAIGEKDYLFPLRWPAAAWLVNLGYAPLIWLLYRRRASAGLALPRERGLVIGCLSLLVVFGGAVVLNAAHVALAIQLQPARVFWILDFLATIYVVWALAELRPGRAVAPVMAAVCLCALSAIRGTYIMRVEFPNRPLFQARVPGDWGVVTQWAQQTSPGSGWLADPNHASLYGTSLRMAAGRDVFVEATKDLAVGMYDRSIALRTRDRIRELGDFAALTDRAALALGAKYELDFLVAERDFSLPVAFRSGAIRVYRLD